MSGTEVIAGRFELLGPLARGNMGVVYRARDVRDDAPGSASTVAVKVMWQRRWGERVSLTDADKNAERFAREIRIMARLSSSNLPRTIDGGLDGDRPYLAMEYIDGITLSSLLAEADDGRLPVTWAAAIGAQVAQGLDAAHRADVIHRDLKPANVMLSVGGVAKVLDFGVGLILDDVDGGRVTSSDVTVGTARYMAPEQASQRTVTAAVDLYALGCVLFELLAGVPPFDGETTYQVLSQHMEQAPVPVSTLRGDVPAELDAIIAALLAKAPTDRPASAAEVAQALARIALGPQGTGQAMPGAPGNPVLALAGLGLGGTEPETDRTTANVPVPVAAEPVPSTADGFDIFAVHQRLIGDYWDFTQNAAVIRDDRIAKFLDEDLNAKSQWPDPWLSLNPSFADGGSAEDLADQGFLDRGGAKIFQTGKTEGGTVCDGRPVRFYRHQRDAIAAARSGDSYVLTTGTGSGKSLAYIVPIVDRVLRARAAGDRAKRVRAIIVYPMNALANSQENELKKYLRDGFGAGREPVTFARYTGQEKQQERERIRANPPDILLTNYVMLELLLTRPDDRRSLIAMASGLEFLVFDELHTYRGRQGADVAFLIRRVKDACDAPDVQCVGTSATMSSQGTAAQRRVVVAKVAGEIFGTPIAERSVIGETLVRATGEDTGPVTIARVSAPAAPAGYADLARDPLAAWIETVFGLDRDDEGSLARRAPTTVQRAAADLAALTGADSGRCELAIQRTLLAGSKAQHPVSGRPLFAFRLHQFLSRGDTVYVTISGESTRRITRKYQAVHPDTDGHLLLPLAFCRECGQEYLAVWRVDRAGPGTGTVTYQARRNSAMADEDDQDGPPRQVSDGYLYLSADLPWPRALADALVARRVPESWFEVSDADGAETLKPSNRRYLPRAVTVDPYGRERPDAGGTEAAFIPAPFRFCLRCGVSYEQVRGTDFAKLATLDREGRSSATSLTSMSIVRSLQAVPENALDKAARKLLTFVDNRQDAALQAGHFNDFVEVTMIRGALHAAAARAVAAGEAGLYYDDLGPRVTRALGLPRQEYAEQPGENPALRQRTDQTLRQVINYRVYLDLDRGWRVTMPNLEQVGLLRIGYLGLDEIAASDDLWRATFPAIRDAGAEVRAEVCRVLLDEMRRSLAIDAECLVPEEFDRIKQRCRGALRREWALEDSDRRPMGIVYPGPGRPGAPRELVSLSGRTKLGRYLRRPGRFPGYPRALSSADATQVIENLLTVLAGDGAGLLAVAEDSRRRGVRGYRLRASALVWQPGDGTQGAVDPLSRTFSGAAEPRVSPYFVRLYRDVAGSLAGLVAREHTAQVAPDVREDREEEFRKGELKLLYCSPTMELGVDIAGLNAVSMRNVPPTPANYAQRSGRAGRSGQPALVTTYCATGNSHDQYYFRNSEKMVAGVVAPPRLDLLNEDLIRSHVHAIWIAEAGLKLGRAIPESVEMDGTEPEGRRRPDPALRLNSAVAAAAADQGAVGRTLIRARAVLAELEGALRTRTSWWDPGWLEQVVRHAETEFDRAFDRWRDLFRAALADQWEQNRRRLDYSLSARDREIAARRRYEAEAQLRLLRSEDTDDRNLAADFNPYRYLASEGYLPGYSFPRLPIAAYIPPDRTYRDQGDYLQRSRFLAIREFGPRALIYHEGTRYEVHRVQLPPASGDPTAPAGVVGNEQAHRCPGCGYHHDIAPGNDRCELCRAPLNAPLTGLLPLHTVYTRPRQRITSDEEERRRAGYKIVTSYRFTDHGDRPGRLDALVSGPAGQTLARLSYGDSALVQRTSLRPTRRPPNEPDGFLIDPVTGTWLSGAQAADNGNRTGNRNDGDGTGDDDGPAGQQRVRVIPYVRDRRNIALLDLAEPVELATALSLMYALERGIEAAFQLEDAELDSELLPPETGPRRRLLLTESAEGGAGVLRLLQADGDALAVAAREALRIAHFNPETGDDLGGPVEPDGTVRDRCARGCYNCLLSYRNQLEHELIDRHTARDLLLAIAHGRTESTGQGVSRTDQAIALQGRADSSLERDFVSWLKENGYRLPDDAQATVPRAYAKPDFIYRRPSAPVAVFIDGPVHDDAVVAERDIDAEERLIDLGWHVIRFRYDDDWARVAADNPNVFGQHRR